jgi:hypothetical protein
MRAFARIVQGHFASQEARSSQWNGPALLKRGFKEPDKFDIWNLSKLKGGVENDYYNIGY